MLYEIENVMDILRDARLVTRQPGGCRRNRHRGYDQQTCSASSHTLLIAAARLTGLDSMKARSCPSHLEVKFQIAHKHVSQDARKLGWVDDEVLLQGD